jgi:hypothetical protein
MTRRRFAILASGLVALNLFLWLAPPGLALQQGIISQLFGHRMVRAEVIVLGPNGSPVDYRIDRGTVVSSGPGYVTIAEQDGTTQTIPVTRNARVDIGGQRYNASRLPRNLAIVVMREANRPARIIRLDGRNP